MRLASLVAIIIGLLLGGLTQDIVPEPRPAEASTGFRLPWTAGESYLVTQGWDGAFSHVCPGYNCYAYDFGLPAGTVLLAAADGVVEAAVGSYDTGGCSPTYNSQTNYVRIRHDDDSVTRYLHLRDVSVSVDQQVKQGDVIGHSGATGYACGDHLHFQRDSGGTSVTIYFEEYKDEELTFGQRVTSQNGPLPTRTATPPLATAAQPPTRTPTPTSTAAPTLTPTPQWPPGDANVDGVTNVIDAAIVLQFVAGLVPSINPAADVNDDSVVDAIDAAIILQYTVGLIDSVPV